MLHYTMNLCWIQKVYNIPQLISLVIVIYFPQGIVNEPIWWCFADGDSVGGCVHLVLDQPLFPLGLPAIAPCRAVCRSCLNRCCGCQVESWSTEQRAKPKENLYLPGQEWATALELPCWQARKPSCPWVCLVWISGNLFTSSSRCICSPTVLLILWQIWPQEVQSLLSANLQNHICNVY